MKKKDFLLTEYDIDCIADNVFCSICVIDNFRVYTGEGNEEFCEESVEELEKAVLKRLAAIITEKYESE